MPNFAARMASSSTPEESPNAAPARQEGGAPRLSSKQLLGARREVVIVHNGREYRLRQTQNGKLILTA